MFVQHMISVLTAGDRRDRHAARRAVPRRRRTRHPQGLLDDDLLDAVIGLAPNLFYGTGIPACILVLRAKGAKPPERAGKVLFINADAEFSAGRAQNYLLPEHVEKIVSAYRAFADIPGYATVVTHEELAANDVNLNIRRYADNAPPPEPQDVRAHLHGGVPRAEVDAKAPLFTAHGFSPRTDLCPARRCLPGLLSGAVQSRLEGAGHHRRRRPGPRSRTAHRPGPLVGAARRPRS